MEHGPDDPALRLFVAFFPDSAPVPDGVLEDGSRLVPPENRHITVLFIGDAPSSRLGEIKEILEQTSKGRSRFALDFDKFTIKSKSDKKGLLWAQFHPHPDLQETHDHLHRQISELGLRAPHRAVVPHVTLAGIRGTGMTRLRKILPTVGTAWPSVSLDHLCLVSSRLSPTGSAYSKISTHRLG